MISLIEARRAGLFQRRHLLPNVVAGIVVGVVALPLSMAFAIASGARPEHGLYTAIVAGLIVAALGGTRVQIAGPTGAFVAILAGVTARYGIDGLQLATLMAGLMLVALGMCRMGAIMRFIPDPVIVGFTAGIGVIIFVGQWKYFFGLPDAAYPHFHERLWHLLQALPRLHLPTTLLACFSLLAVLLAPRVPGLRRVPGPLSAMVLATLLQWWYQFEGVATIGSAFGALPQQLPQFALPVISAARLLELTGPAFAIAMLGAIESLLSAVVADGMAGTRHDANQELIGQGLANIAAPLLGGFAATGAIARTATNIRNGATSPLAGIVHSATLVLVILALAPLVGHVPLAALAAILFVVAWNMSDARHFAAIVRRAPRPDVAILLITFALTVLVDLVVAVNIGMVLAAFHVVRRLAASVGVAALDGKEAAALAGTPLPHGVTACRIDGPLFFGAVEQVERALLDAPADTQALIICLERVPFMDFTALQTLDGACRKLQARGTRVILCRPNERVRTKLRMAGFDALLGKDAIVPTLRDAVELLGSAHPAH